MELFLIDAIGPFFRGYKRKRINWSKIIFTHLDDQTEGDWAAIRVLLLYLTGLTYRLFQRRDPARIPKFLRKSAMGVDVLFK
jgi:hypothetical protein